MQVILWFLMVSISLLFIAAAVVFIVATINLAISVIKIIPLIPNAIRTWCLAGEKASKYTLEGDWSSVRFFRGTYLETYEERRDRKNLREMLFQAGCKTGSYLVGIWRGNPYLAKDDPSFCGRITVHSADIQRDLSPRYTYYRLTVNGSAHLQIQTS